MSLVSKIRVIGSNSNGNSYILECGNEKLLIELGVDFKQVLRALNYDLTNVHACLVSHKHTDHAKYIPSAKNHGLPVFSCQEVADKHDGVAVLELGKKTKIGGFTVQPIEVPHSCQCYAFLIEHEAMGRLLFCTDCERFGYRIKNLNHICIEANWDEDVLIDNMCDDIEIRSRFEHHMELNNTILALKTNYGVSLQTVCLVHLSSGNADPKKFKKRVVEELGFNNVCVCESGLEVELSNSEF
jgi:phosphoribosyl 1,2-cyclic phosphodiesterase